MAKLIRANGIVEEIVCDDPLSLDQLHTYVGGYIEAIRLPSGHTMWCNEEGKLNGLPLNPLASLIYELAFGRDIDIVVGDVIVTNDAESGDGWDSSPFPIKLQSEPLYETPEYTDWDALGAIRMEIHHMPEMG